MSWGMAIETHYFWNQACTVIDPHEQISPHGSGNGAAAAVRLSPYRQWRTVANAACAVCRINRPHALVAAALNKRPLPTPHLGLVYVCRDHRHTKDTPRFCSLCLGSAPEFGIAENEDTVTWPGAHATCRSCRADGLYRRIANNPRELQALGYWRPNCPSDAANCDIDWETRHTLVLFLERGDGTVNELLLIAHEKLWMRRFTNLAEILSQALAAAKYKPGLYVQETEEELEDDESDDEDDLPTMLMATEDQGVRELALGEWARQRILDGFWFSPADQWYRNVVPGHPPQEVRAVHPCPWNSEVDAADEENNVHHPREETLMGPPPPSFHLCEQAYIAFQRAMRSILLAPMNNLVRKIVIECGADGVDPGVRASRMDMEDVLRALREEEGLWYNGIDWLERRANGEREDQRRKEKEREEDSSSTSSKSSKSDGSHTTSPVLSTSTLQTTPSPSPTAEKGEGPITIPIPVSPVLEAPQLLHQIPYVPVTAAHLPQYSSDALKTVWREACSPLYHCRCSVCERAMLQANVAAGNIVPSQIIRENPGADAYHDAPTAEIRIDDGEEEIDARTDTTEQTDMTTTTEDGEEYDDEDDEDEDEIVNIYFNNSKKRTSAELDADADAEGEDDTQEHDVNMNGIPQDDSCATIIPIPRRSPSKRMRMTRTSAPPSPPSRAEKLRASVVSEPPPTRLRKRSSEELQDATDDESLRKKMRVGAASSDDSPPRTSSAPEEEGVPTMPPVEFDALYSFDSSGEDV
ncbi:hypothetical protein PLICRDRAFT_34291 [Plicaturopsis crispa FD-325 SS-3]|nr:hypothetical protein PLICRDRAFT_34291 [Plicaturopsis crispa FD-325 SS-3]